VPEDVPFVEERAEDTVEMQVRPADRGRSDPDDCVRRLFDARIRDGVDAYVARTVPGNGLHLMLLPSS
jgi:hypothetical protein